MPVIDYQLYDNEEEVYATFKFFYRGQGQFKQSSTSSRYVEFP